MTRTEKLEAVIEEVIKPFEDGFQVQDIWTLLTTVMDSAEEWIGLTNGGDKKAFALEVLEIVLNSLDLPGPDWITKRVVMWLAPSLIDKLVLVARGGSKFGQAS